MEQVTENVGVKLVSPRIKHRHDSAENDQIHLLKIGSDNRATLRASRYRKRQLFSACIIFFFGVLLLSLVFGFVVLDRRALTVPRSVPLILEDTSTACSPDIGEQSEAVCDEIKIALDNAKAAEQYTRNASEYIITAAVVFFFSMLFMSIKGQRALARYRVLQSLPNQALDLNIYAEGPENGSKPKTQVVSKLHDSMQFFVQDEFHRVIILTKMANSIHEKWDDEFGDPRWGRLKVRGKQVFHINDLFLNLLRTNNKVCFDSTGECIHFKRCIQVSWKLFLPYFQIIKPNVYSENTDFLSFVAVRDIIKVVQEHLQGKQETKVQDWVWTRYFKEYKSARFSKKKYLKNDFEEFLININEICKKLKNI